jgi:hypothetical protein
MILHVSDPLVVAVFLIIPRERDEVNSGRVKAGSFAPFPRLPLFSIAAGIAWEGISYQLPASAGVCGGRC